MEERLKNIESHLERLTCTNPSHVILGNRDLSDMLKVCPKTVQKWRDKRYIKFSKIGREIFYKLSDVLDMLEKFSI